MDQPWLTVIGTDDGGPCSLSARARELVEAAEVLVGGARHHALFPGVRAERLTWRSPIEGSLDEIARLRGRRVVVLASGDPLCFGIGTTLSRRFSAAEMRIWPAPSSAALVRARLRWPADEVEVVSLHAAPPARLRRHLWPGAKLVVLSRDETTPGLIGRMLADAGFGASRVWVLEHLGGREERIVETAVATLGEVPVARLNVVAIACRSERGSPLLPVVPGLPDEAFASDGLLTRREIRAVTLARLQPGPGQRLIDVGAGSGSVAIEWLRAARNGDAVAVERDGARCAMIAGNAEALGTPELVVVADEAPGCLAALEPADAIFVGGGLARPGMLDACMSRLRPGGRLVANAVTLEGEEALTVFQRQHGGELTRIALARAEPLGRLRGWRPAMPVTQLATLRP